MDLGVLTTCALIILARIGDVSLGTIRTICVVNGRALISWILGFFEVLIWIFAVSKVLSGPLSLPYALAYAFGFATGNYVGVTVEQFIAFGEQVVRIFTRRGAEVAEALRGEGFRVTEFDGRGRDGLVSLLFIETRRKDTRRLLRHLHHTDPNTFYLVDDIRLARYPASRQHEPTGWRAIVKRK
jgi:uncharacterized protein YebE (UPF0316 family)